MTTKADTLRERTRRFAVDILRFVRCLPNDPPSSVVGRQLAKAGTSMSANYRAAGRARSRAEFIAKLGVVVEEADETEHWLQIVHEAGLSARDAKRITLTAESAELRAIFCAALQTARRNYKAR
ncbi:MAG TPA: four helix bundle protein [Vicinamibacterales bacterium]|nr:four helix bundle protein [Vicinamibacterales bacterium]